MTQEDYVSFETAKLLKENGFNEMTIYHYTNGDTLQHNIIYNKYKNSQLENAYSAPTLQMVMKWLREVHHKHCCISYDIGLEWFFQIVDLKEIVEYDYPETKYYHAENETGFNTYEEACEAAIKYCLEHLI